MNAGTYTETSQCVLAPGVSIEGVGVTSIIKSHYTSSGSGDGLINLSSSSQNTPGNQSISYLKLDGDNLTGNGAIYVHYRGNVLVHHCTIVDFSSTGIIVEGENSWNSQPVTFSSGNQIYNNTITNCHGGSGGGNIRITGQTACLIHDNIVDGRARSMQNSVTLSNNKATTIYNNTFYTLNNRGSAFNFVFEIWDTWGGLEIRNNTFNVVIWPSRRSTDGRVDRDADDHRRPRRAASLCLGVLDLPADVDHRDAGVRADGGHSRQAPDHARRDRGVSRRSGGVRVRAHDAQRSPPGVSRVWARRGSFPSP